MKSKKLISLLLAGAMSLPFAFWTVSADNEPTLLVSDNFAEGVEGYIAGGVAEGAVNPSFNAGISHTDDGSGSLEFGLHHISQYASMPENMAMRGVGRQLKSFTGLSFEVGEKYRISAYIKGHDERYHSRTYRLGIVTANTKDGSWIGNTKAYADVIPVSNGWTEISFDYEPATPVNTDWYLRLFIPMGKTHLTDNSNYLTYANDNYDIVYLDDIKFEKYAKIPFELVSVTKGGAALKNGAAVYNNEKITVEFSKNLQSDQTGAVTATAGDGTEITPSLSVSLNKLYITLPDAVHDTTYTLSLGNFTALDGDTLNAGTEYSLTADNKVIFYDTFDENICKVDAQPYLKYTNETADVNGSAESGVLRMGLFGNGMANFQQCGTYIASRTIGGKIDVGKTYEISAYVKGQTGRFRNGFKFAMGVGEKAKKDNTANSYITVTDEWKRISILWTPTDTNKDYSKYVVYVNPRNVQGYDEGSAESDENYNVFYIDDVMVREKPSLELMRVTPAEGTVLTAGVSGITAEFNLPLGEGHEVTVTNGKGVVVNSIVTVDNTRLNIAIPNRDHGETYTVSFNKIISVSGDELAVEKTYTYTADATIMNQTFDENMGTFGTSRWNGGVQNCYDWTSAQNHTPGKQSGAALLRTNANFIDENSAAIGIDSDLGDGIVAGQNYVVSAYIKGEPGRYRRGFKFQIGIYRFHTGSYVTDITINSPAEIKVTDEWQKIAFVWTAPENHSEMKLRIGPVNRQLCDKTDENHYIFYVDDVSIMPVGNVPSAYLSNVAVTYLDGDTTKTVTSAAELNDKILTVSGTLTNLGANTQPYTVMAAVYAEDGRLIDVKAAEGSMEVGGKAEISITGLDLTNVYENCTMKLFAWDRSNNTQTPLAEVYNPF